MNSELSPLEDRQHFEQLHRWLEMESQAEMERLAERRQRAGQRDVEASGETLIDLVVEDYRTAVGGLYLLTLVKRNRTRELPWNRLRVGAPVVLADMEDSSNDATMGVVSQRSQRTIQVAVDEWPDGDRFRLDLSPDERTRRMQHAALAAVEQARGRLGELRRVLLGQRSPKFFPLKNEAAVESNLDTLLNETQREAIRFALTADDLAIIHGPPGTGKTTTVVELIRQLAQQGQQVLACAPSNTAVDNLLERSLQRGLNAVRLGHPARVAESLRDHSLDALVEGHREMRVVRQLMKEAEELFRKASRYTRARPARGARQESRAEARQLKQDARRLERQVVQSVIDQAEVICSTTTIDDELLGDRTFPWVIIDEACQCTEPSCWVPLLRAERVVLAGDHCQLPPTIVSIPAAAEGFGVSLLERSVQRYAEQVTRRLEVQYRMHEQIMEFSSLQFYDASLVADESVRLHRLDDLPHVHAADVMNDPVTFVDTAGADWLEEQEPDGESRFNRQEAEWVWRQVDQIVDTGVLPAEIAVIAPYAAQVRLLRQLRPVDGVEVDTVDG
ncbi:MAG: AAA family ATPase, partial [Planctomycetales bacterium]|nr:AAA family ATPase [Planctomycetales bacterium]